MARDARADGRRLVLCGDLNVARTDLDVHPKERKPRRSASFPRSAPCSSGSSRTGWSTSGARSAPDDDGLFTWWAPWRNMRQRNIGWRLDYVLASEALAATASACPVLRDVGTSDHAPVMATFG